MSTKDKKQTAVELFCQSTISRSIITAMLTLAKKIKAGLQNLLLAGSCI